MVKSLERPNTLLAEASGSIELEESGEIKNNNLNAKQTISQVYYLIKYFFCKDFPSQLSKGVLKILVSRTEKFSRYFRSPCLGKVLSRNHHFLFIFEELCELEKILIKITNV